MRRRSFTGPLLLLLIGAFFLWRNLHPEAPVFDIVSRYWPFLLILWGLMRLVEVVVYRKRGWVSFTGGEVVLVVLICVAGSGMWEARQHGVRFNTGGLDMFGEQYDYPLSASAPAGGLTRITFEHTRGNIKVTGIATQEITVTGRKNIRAWSRSEADRSNDNTPVEIVAQGDRILIRTNQDRVRDNQRIIDDIEVTVPMNMSVEARGRSGDYEIVDLAGDVELYADRGDVRLARVGGKARLEIGRSELIRASDVKGAVELQGNGADVDLENIAGQVTITGSYRGTLEFKNLAKPLVFEGSRNTELHVQAVPGRLTMDLGAVSGSNMVGPLRLVTGSRDVKLERFTESLELETQRGDIQLQPSLPMPSIEARSNVGRIELIVPAKAMFDLQATAEKGEAVNDFGPQIQREMDGRTATLKGKVGEGPSVRLTANRGSVSIRKQGMAAEAEMPPVPPTPPGKLRKLPKDLKDSEVKM